MSVHFLCAFAEHPAQDICRVFVYPYCRSITTQWLGRHDRENGQHFHQLLLNLMRGIRKKTHFCKDLIWRWEWRCLETEQCDTRQDAERILNRPIDGEGKDDCVSSSSNAYKLSSWAGLHLVFLY